MNKYERAIASLKETGEAIFKVFGNSMLPLIKTKSLLTFKATNDYQVGDVVFSKVKGNYIDAHKITRIDGKGRYLISNNHGHDNGWTKTIYGRVIKVNGSEFGRKIKDQT